MSMKNSIVIIFLLNGFLCNAQIIVPDISSASSVGTGIHYENTIHWQIDYVHHFKCAADDGSPYYLSASASTPLYLIATKNKNVSLDFGRQWQHNNWFFNSLLGVQFFGYSDVMANGAGLSAQTNVQGGINKNNWFSGLGVGYKNNVFTTFNFETPVNDVASTTLYNTNGNFTLSAFGGVNFLTNFSVQAYIAYRLNRDFQTYAPYTTPYGGGVIFIYWL